jgi:hypothetical protein
MTIRRPAALSNSESKDERNMSEETQSTADETFSEWSRETFDAGVREIIELGVLGGAVVEARPSWALPDSIVIGQIRETNVPTGFTWLICGDLPTDHVGSAVATTPRDAARHFSLKWQLDAARNIEPALAETLIAKAEALYELVEDESLWEELA